MEEIKPFEFRQCVSILKSTGRKAKNLRELRDVIASVSDESIFHHTYRYFLKGYTLQYTNDFASWVGEILKESILAEQLSNIDPYAYKSVAELRSEILRVIDEYQKTYPEPRQALSGDEFYFNEAVLLVTPVGIHAKNLAEFLMAVKYIPAESVYFHFYEARTRLGGGIDDFSRWFEDALGKKVLAEKVGSIDIFMHSLEETRRHIIEIVEEEVEREMGKF